MAILITGGAGFVGSHTAKHLHEAGCDVVVLDNLSTGSRDDARWGSFVHGDIADSDLVRSILREHSVTAVIHLAASAKVGESMARPNAYFANNVIGSLRLLDAMVAEDVSRIVFASSCSVYGDLPSWSANEEDQLTPVSPYGESKLQTERALRWYERAHGIQWAALRYFNVSGADEGLGENLATSIRIIPKAVYSILNPQTALQIFGTDFLTSDGSAVRDFVHVHDVARANLRALNFLQENDAGEVINIGSGTGVTVFEVIEAVSREMGQAVAYNRRSARLGDPAHAVSDVSKAHRLLGWEPVASGITEIVGSVVKAAKLARFP